MTSWLSLYVPADLETKEIESWRARIFEMPEDSAYPGYTFAHLSKMTRKLPGCFEIRVTDTWVFILQNKDNIESKVELSVEEMKKILEEHCAKKSKSELFLIPQVHMGSAASHMEQRGIKTIFGEKNRQIALLNKIIRDSSLPLSTRQEAQKIGQSLHALMFDTANEVEEYTRGEIAKLDINFPKHEDSASTTN